VVDIRRIDRDGAFNQRGLADQSRVTQALISFIENDRTCVLVRNPHAVTPLPPARIAEMESSLVKPPPGDARDGVPAHTGAGNMERESRSCRGSRPIGWSQTADQQ
jgi:hypothetical protein